MASRFTKEYQALQQQMGLTNIHAVPRIVRVVVNVGVGKQRDNSALLKAVQHDLAAITGQKPHERRARKAVSGFNVRQGNLVGYRVTLRGRRMEDFVRRFVDITLPRVRDFRGIPLKSLDGQGNLSVGVAEQLPFPEIQPEKTDVIFGLQVTFVTTAVTDEIGEQLFRVLGFPLTREADDAAEVTLDTARTRRAREEAKHKLQEKEIPTQS
ncbi:MAG: 50S ribosomal protein L5 [Candidatus Andersenbacteria bacterium]